MTQREISIAGRVWKVSLAGRFTTYTRDELPVVFEHSGPDGAPVRRLARFSPLGSRSGERALGELSDAELVALWHQSQEAWTSPELGYARR
jgi:hypothetical protein